MPPGYLIRAGPEELDLLRFERLVEEGRRALAGGEAETAAARLHEALGLWRGPALADFAYEEFASVESARLEELRLAAIEDRVDADLALGEHAALTGELQALVTEHPLRERLRGQLMLALYRSGRQAEALETFQAGRRELVEELGLEPSAALRELERAMLRQDPGLQAPGPSAPERPESRALLVLSQDDAELDALLAVGTPLASGERPHDLVLARLVTDHGRLRDEARALNERRDVLTDRGIASRSCAFTSETPAADVLRLVREQRVELVLTRLPEEELAAEDIGSLLTEAPCDVGLVAGAMASLRGDGPVAVPFGGGEHDWAALELGAWLAASLPAPLLLLGPVAEPESGQRDASRLLARASMIVQRIVGVSAEPLLTPPGAEPVLEASADARALVIGLSQNWREKGLGTSRTTHRFPGPDAGPARAPRRATGRPRARRDADALHLVARERDRLNRSRHGPHALATLGTGSRCSAVPDECAVPGPTRRRSYQEAVMGQFVQLAGALLILAAFVLAQAGFLEQRSYRYLVANLAGAAVLAFDAWIEGQLGFLVLEAAWALVSVWSLGARLREQAPARRETGDQVSAPD